MNLLKSVAIRGHFALRWVEENVVLVLWVAIPAAARAFGIWLFKR